MTTLYGTVEFIQKNIDKVGNSWSSRPNSLANVGGYSGDIFARDRGVEYNGLSVKLLDRVYPLFTLENVQGIINDVLNSKGVIDIVSRMGLNSVEELQYSLYRWISNITKVRTEQIMIDRDRMKELDRRVKILPRDPINVPIEVMDIGYNSNTRSSVVPEDWMGRIFENGEEMHRSMDVPGKAPTTFAVTFTMTPRKVSEILSEVPVDSDVWMLDENLRVSLREEGLPGHNYVKLGDHEYIGFILSDLLEPISEEFPDSGLITEEGPRLKQLSTGVLSSILQKSVRRGNPDLIQDVLNILNSKPNYNIPSMGFMRVSSSRQCSWRLYVSALEDVGYYIGGSVSMTSLILLSLISQKLTDYRYTRKVMRRLIDTARRLCNTREYIDFNRISGENTRNPALELAIDYMPMMSGDKKMIENYLMLSHDKYIRLSRNRDISEGSERSSNIETILASFDNHSVPDIILIFQGLIDRVMTTKDVSKFIWDYSSSVNYRKRLKRMTFEETEELEILRDIQDKIYWNGFPNKKNKSRSTDYSDDEVGRSLSTDKSSVILSDSDKRESFMVVFGLPFKVGRIEYMIGGNDEVPIMQKVTQNRQSKWILYGDSEILDKYPRITVNLDGVKSPLGYRWIAPYVTAKYRNGQFIAELPDSTEITVDLFDGSNLLRNNTVVPEYTIHSDAFSISRKSVDSAIDYRLNSSDILYDLGFEDMVDGELIILTYTKIFNRVGDNPVTIGPVDRSGNKTENSISPKYEGRLWYIFSYLSWLYPDAVSISGTIRFNINTESPEYTLLVTALREMLTSEGLFNPSILTTSNPEIITELWNHQKDTVDLIYSKMNQGVHGMGDASDVGAGKTLTSLALSVKLMESDNVQGYSGILVLLPNKSLIDSWTTEIQKHTKGFDVKVHSAKKKVYSNEIFRNTIVLSALNTMRDHPIRNPWILTVIDECLSVQNSSARWTEEAWKQTLISRGVILLSATFFRSRYNKLYYMLSMLQSIIPNNIEYLPVVLNERIIVHKELSTGREWIENTHYIPFPTDIRERYDNILYSDMRDSDKYGKLQSLLNTQRPYVARWIKGLIGRLGENDRAVIYTSGDPEAKIFSDILDIPIYGTVDPRNTRHIIATINKASVGVNDLVYFNTVILRPPPPDLLPQIKGRLDRPGQENTKLFLNYFMIEDSIDIGLELRMKIANNFLNTYIMPLAEFYTLSLSLQG